MEQRTLGKTGLTVGEIGLALDWGPQAEPIVERARERGCSLFFLGADWREAERSPMWEKRGLRFVHPGERGDLGLRAPGEGREGLWRGHAGASPPSTDFLSFLGIPYNLLAQESSITRMPVAARNGWGILALQVLADGALRGTLGHAPRGSAADRFRFLVRPGRTFAQAAIRFVLANEYVSCAVAEVSTWEEAEEALGAAQTEPLTFRELEQVFEIWAGRCET